jgi:L-rhamnose 1-dehydrogenase
MSSSLLRTSSGIGRAVAIYAVQHRARAIIVSDVTEEPREDGGPTIAEIEKLGVTVRFHRTDCHCHSCK